MRPYQASLLNSLILIFFGIWGIFTSMGSSPTVFIPAVIGVLLLAINDGVKNENKHIAHLAVLLTLLSFGSIMPLITGLNDGDVLKILRQSLILLSSFYAMITFIKSFIKAKRDR